MAQSFLHMPKASDDDGDEIEVEWLVGDRVEWLRATALDNDGLLEYAATTLEGRHQHLHGRRFEALDEEARAHALQMAGGNADACRSYLWVVAVAAPGDPVQPDVVPGRDQMDRPRLWRAATRKGRASAAPAGRASAAPSGRALKRARADSDAFEDGGEVTVQREREWGHVRAHSRAGELTPAKVREIARAVRVAAEAEAREDGADAATARAKGHRAAGKVHAARGKSGAGAAGGARGKAARGGDLPDAAGVMELLTADGVFAALEAVTLPPTQRGAVMRRDDGGLAAVAAAPAGAVPSRGVNLGVTSTRDGRVVLSRGAQDAELLLQLLLAFKVAAAERRAPDDGDDANDDSSDDDGPPPLPGAMQGLPCTSVQVNRMEDARGCAALHCDANNAGPSLIIGLGAYKGGELWVDKRGALDVKRTWHRFDGTDAHATLPFERGPRYTLIFWCHKAWDQLPPAERQAAEQLGFVFPTPAAPAPRAHKAAAAPSADAVAAFRAHTKCRGVSDAWAEGAIRSARAAPPRAQRPQPEPAVPPQQRPRDRPLPAPVAASAGQPRARDRYPETFQKLIGLGFPEDNVEAALEAECGDLDSATEILLGD